MYSNFEAQPIVDSVQDAIDTNQLLQKQFRTVGLTIFLASLGLTTLRLLFLALGIWGVDLSVGDGFVADAIFTLLMQVGVMFALPFCMYKFVLKKSGQKVLHFSHVRKTSAANLGLSVLIGICCFVATIGISLLWNIFLGALGYTASSSDAVGVDSTLGGFGVFISLILVGVLPGFCEEFGLRGGYLNVLYSTYGKTAAVLVGALTFGLFHQNVQQVFYTAVMGTLLVYVTILTKSLWCAVIIHLVNNSLSTYLSYASAYKWVGRGFFDIITDNFGIAILVYIVVVGVLVGLVLALNALNSGKSIVPKNRNQRNLMISFATVTPVMVPSGVLSSTPDNQLLSKQTTYKPHLADYAYYFGALIVTLLGTVFTFVWGLS